MNFKDLPASQSLELQVYANAAHDREPVKIILIGSRVGVNSIVHLLHHLRFAEVFEWTEALKAPELLTIKPKQIMRMAIKYLPENPQR